MMTLPSPDSVGSAARVGAGVVTGMFLSSLGGGSSSPPAAGADASDDGKALQEAYEAATPPELMDRLDKVVGELEGSQALPRAGTTVYEVNADVDADVADDFKAWLRPHAQELLALDGFVEAEILEREPAAEAKPPKPQVVFVLGGPGAGKGTQCDQITANYDYHFISAGDCLRAERKNPDSKDGQLINDYIARGAIVPVEITIALIQKAMAKSGKTKFLIDGFPRNADNVQGWYKNVGDAADVRGVLFFDCPEAEMERRILERGKTSGRVDDDAAVIRKRFKTYQESTRPVLDAYATMGLVHKVAADRTVDEVFADVKPVIEQLNASMPDATATAAAARAKVPLTIQYRVDTRAHLQQYFDVHAARLRGDGLKLFGGKIDFSRRILKTQQVVPPPPTTTTTTTTTTTSA
eukprot:g5181.t1